MSLRLVKVSTRERQFPEAREQMYRIAPAHPFAGGRVLHEAMGPYEVVAGRGEIPLQQRDVAEVELGVGEGLVITAPTTALRRAPIQFAGRTEISALHVDPTDGVQIT